MDDARRAIETELHERVAELRAQENNNNVAAKRLSQRVLNDLYLLRETGTYAGIENYSRHLSHRAPGSTPSTLLDYLPNNNDSWWLIVDESHLTLPQIKAMFYGDRKRKESLVAHGYRLPSALDNRPLMDTEFWSKVSQALFVSATRPDRIGMEIRPTCMWCDPTIRPNYSTCPNGYGTIVRNVRWHWSRRNETQKISVAIAKHHQPPFHVLLKDDEHYPYLCS